MVCYSIPSKRLSNIRFFPNNESILAVVGSESKSLFLGGILIILELSQQNIFRELAIFVHKNGLFDLEWCNFDTNKTPSYVLTGSGDSNIQLWNVFAPSRAPDIYSGHKREVFSINWSKIENKLVSAAYEKSIILWDLSKKTPLQKFFVDGGVVHQVEFNKNNSKMFASVSSDNNLKIWDINSNTYSSSFSIRAHTDKISSCSWSPCDTSTIATCSKDASINGWDLRNSRVPLFQLRQVSSFQKIKFSPFNYGLLASVSDDGKTKIWSCFNKEKPIKEFLNHFSPPSGLDWNSFENTSQLGKITDCGLDEKINVFDFHPPEEKWSFE